MTERLKKTRQILRDKGLWELLKQATKLGRYKVCSYSNYNIYECNLAALTMPDAIGDLTLRIITRVDEIKQLESEQLLYEGFEIPRHKEIVCKGAVLFYAFVGSELVHDGQVFLGREAHTMHPFSFAMSYGYTVGVVLSFTHPEYRRKGISQHVHSEVLQYLKDKGYSRTWGVTTKDNVIQGALIKLGYKLYGRGCRLILLSKFKIEWVTLVGKRLPCKVHIPAWHWLRTHTVEVVIGGKPNIHFNFPTRETVALREDIFKMITSVPADDSDGAKSVSGKKESS